MTEKLPENKPNNSGNIKRRDFLKAVAFGGVGFGLGHGTAPLEILKNEIDGNKERKGNIVTITLKNSKKVSLIYGVHKESFSKDQFVPESEILGIENYDNFKKLFHNMMFHPEIEHDIDQERPNNDPILKEMIKNKKPLYKCDVTKIQELDSTKIGDKINSGYLYLAESILTSAVAMDFIKAKLWSRLDFLKYVLVGLGVGIMEREKIREGYWDRWENPESVRPLDQLKKKFFQLDQESFLGTSIGKLSDDEMFLMDKIIVLVRSIIMAIKLRSALRMSETQSITMSLGAAHVLVEDFVDMDDEELVKKLIPFKDGLKSYFYINSISELEYISYEEQSLTKANDQILENLVEKYLIK